MIYSTKPKSIERNMIRLGILGSTRGTHLVSLVDAISQKKLNAEIVCVISNKKDAYILERAKSYQLPHYFINPHELTRDEYDKKISAFLNENEIDLIVLIGYMRILSAEFVKTWKNKIINIHPSLLPAFAGKMNDDVHRAVLESGVSETGCTAHYVTEQVDCGPILVQKKCVVLPDDTLTSLKQRVQGLEKEVLIEAIQLLC
jgi:phosphoribosylglycinamide formyltransferase-1